MMPAKYASKRLSLFTWHRVFFALFTVLQLSTVVQGQDLTINATFAANITAAQQAVIQQAINEWHVIIETKGINPTNLPVTFQNAPLGGSTIGLTNFTFSTTTGAVISAVVSFDNDGSTTWFIDPTPGNVSDDTIPAGQFDYLSTARHEIGHAVGFFIPTVTPSPAVNPFINATNTTFDAGRLNIGITLAGGGHTAAAAHPNDLMNTGINATQRRTISPYPSASFIARAYQCDITMNFVDGANTSTETGSATDPWNTVTEGLALTPVGRSLLLIPGAYTVPVPLSHNTSITINAARGGGAVVSGP
jgi:hypothetical protein